MSNRSIEIIWNAEWLTSHKTMSLHVKNAVCTTNSSIVPSSLLRRREYDLKGIRQLSCEGGAAYSSEVELRLSVELRLCAKLRFSPRRNSRKALMEDTRTFFAASANADT